jgi:purine catabolism regulator
VSIGESAESPSSESLDVHTLPTVRQALGFDSLRRGRAEVVAGASGLERRVRWVHVSELATIAEMLRGGELLLTTGIALPEDAQGLTKYVRSLADADAAGIVVGLGPRFVDSVPAAMVRAADKHNLPLMVLRRFTRFIEVTEDVHSQIVDIQVEELRASERIHATFTELAVEGIGFEDIVRQVARMAGCPVVLENLVHRMLTYDTAGRPAEEVLANWEALSRSVRAESRTAYDPALDWLVSSVGARGNDWGRLVLISPKGPLKRMEMLAERAASTLALSRLLERDDKTIDLHVHGTLLASLLSPTQPIEALALEAEAVGVPLLNRRVVGLAIRLGEPVAADATRRQVDLRTLADSASAAARAAKLFALVGLVEDYTVALLLSLPANADERAVLERWTDSLRQQAPGLNYIVAVGSGVTRMTDIRGSLIEAMQVAAGATRCEAELPYFRSSDLRLRGLLQLMRDDLRLQSFAEREVGALIAYDQLHGTSLVAVLRSYLDSGRNKTAAAERAHVSRPWMYERLARIESILNVSLESEDVCVSMQVALMALDAMQS